MANVTAEEQPTTRRRCEFALGLLCLLVVVLMAYGNVVFLRETLVQSANYSPIDDRLNRLRPGTIKWPPIANWHDVGGAWFQWEPAGQLFARSYRRGAVPMWDPSVAGGVDAHVNVTQAQYFLPFVILLLAGNSPLLCDVYYLLMLLASGLACFVLLHRNGFHWASSAFMGVGWMLSGPMTQNVSTLLGQTYATLPLFVLAVDFLLDRMTWRALGVAALTVGLCTYSSFLPIVISGYVLIGIQALVYAWSGMTRVSFRGLGVPGRCLIAFGTAIGVALGLAAFILLPLAFAQHDNEFFHSWYGEVGKMHYSVDLLLTLLSPRLSYDVWQTVAWTEAFIPKQHIWSTHFFYVGFVVVLLLPLARRDQRPRVRRLVLFFAVAALGLFLKLMGVPPVQWVAKLPVFRFLHFIPYFSGAFGLALVGLAACSVETLIRVGIGRRRFLALAALAVAAIAAVPTFVLVKGYNASASHATCVRYFVEFARILLVVAGLLVVALLRMRGGLRGPVAGVLVISLVVLELVPIAFHRRFQRAKVWSDVPEYVRFLKLDTQPFRIHSAHDLALTANTFQGVGLSGIGSRGVFNQRRYTLLVKQFFETETNSGFILPRTLLPRSRRVLDLLNVKYVVAYRPSEEESAELGRSGLMRAATDGNFVVFSNPRVWPRAFVAHDFHVVANLNEALTAVGSIATQDMVILEQRPTFAPAPGPSSPCTILSYEPNGVTISGETGIPGVLVLLDAFGPGWTATLNGKPAPLLPAYAAFRGVEVPVGRWEMNMRYVSPFSRAGLILSFVSLALVAAALGVSRSLPGVESGDLHEGLNDG